jgi:hypothetical protein
MPREPKRWRAVVALALFASCACRSETERRRTLDALLVSSAVEAVREAPHDDKGAALERLRVTSCTDARACAVKELCLQAYTLHQKSVATTRALARAEPSGELPSGAAELLARAERDLAAAKRMSEECLRLETALVLEARP